jgi:Rrf2 family protein
MLSMKAKYALRAMSELARAGAGRVQAHALAQRCRAPGKFLETILVDLRIAGFIDSRRGQHGGHALARAPEQIMIGDLIRVIDGPLAPVRCASVTAYEPCRDCPDPDACALRALMRESRDALSQVLDRRSLRDFASVNADAATPRVLSDQPPSVEVRE